MHHPILLSLPPRCTAGYQPHFDVLVSTAWGAPEVIFKGFGELRFACTLVDKRHSMLSVSLHCII